jgi:hypothetical protein
VPGRLMEEALRAWREGERVLEELPPLTPEHESIRLAIIQLRDAYQMVSTPKLVTDEIMATTRALIDQSWQVIRHVQARLAEQQTAGGPSDAG